MEKREGPFLYLASMFLISLWVKEGEGDPWVKSLGAPVQILLPAGIVPTFSLTCQLPTNSATLSEDLFFEIRFAVPPLKCFNTYEKG